MSALLPPLYLRPTLCSGTLTHTSQAASRDLGELRLGD